MQASAADVSRWQKEADFFDRWAAAKSAEQLGPIDGKLVARYRAPGKLHPKEFCCRLVGQFAGKRILDVGCGEGENSLLLGALGARVTGIDVSPHAIELARARAKISGLESTTEFICSPIETARLPERAFDVVWGDNILHHLLPVLDGTMEAITKCARPGGLIVFMEPTNLNPTLRRIRFLVPVHTEATPGERPLERGDIAIVARHVPDLRRRHFSFLGRLTRFLLPHCSSYENASPLRRLVTDGLALIDAAVLRVPKVETLGGMSVLYGHAPAHA
jgi:2-polyprenyl-3-methyl-5-hydroxy-6-metoxy-1,4-benzoquinol methylase